MKPAPFDYFDPRSLDEALARLAECADDAKVLAGGQSLVPMLALRLARPAALIDINRVPGLDGIAERDGALRVGALVRQRTLERWAAGRMPLLATGLASIGHPAIRNRGTVAGSIAHADPASELPALLLCLDGSVRARRPGGEREIAAADFFEGPLTTALAPDEIVTETRWPLPGAGHGWGFHEVARRPGDFAMVGVAALIDLRAGRIARARVALFGAGPHAVRAAAAERMLEGQVPGDELVAEAAAAAAGHLDPPSDIHAPAAYRRRVARTLTARALADALARAREP